MRRKCRFMQRGLKERKNKSTMNVVIDITKEFTIIIQEDKIMFNKIGKKCSMVALAFCLFLSNANGLVAKAATSSEVSTSEPGYGYVSLSSGTLNVRQHAYPTAEIVGSLANNSRVMIVGESGPFYKVQYNTNGNYGFVSKDYVVFMERDYYLKVNTSDDELNMRSGPGTNYGELTEIPYNTSFAYIEDATDGWYFGVYGNVSGYTSGRYTLKCSYSN